jgi:2,4-dienoyl-CoA reductase (NADPH2)
VRYLADAARLAGVETVLGTEMTPELAKKGKPDAVVLATGGNPRIPDIPGIDNKHVVMAEDVLTGTAPLGRNVVVIGAGGVACEVGIYVARRGSISPEAALFLVEHGVLGAEEATGLALKRRRNVTLVRRGSRVGDSLGRSTRWVVLQELKRLGIRTVTDAQYVRITKNGLLISVADEKQLIEADTIVLAAGYEVDPQLEQAWRDVATEVHVIGDAQAPQKGIDAIYAGTLIGRHI